MVTRLQPKPPARRITARTRQERRPGASAMRDFGDDAEAIDGDDDFFDGVDDFSDDDGVRHDGWR